MRNSVLLAVAVVLLATGGIGLVVTALVSGGRSDSGTYASLGERIYYTGEGLSGPIPRTTPGGRSLRMRMMAGAACVDCHGADGRGGRLGMMFQAVEVPDIRYSALTSGHLEGGASEPGWTDEAIARAIREGIEPNGERLKAPMPRWDMTDAEVGYVIDYLKELSR